jgi:hypothetical protein
MNTEKIQLWIDDLETTSALQGTTTLRTRDDKFCCLGRACEVSGLAKWEVSAFSERYTCLGKKGTLTSPILDFFGLTSMHQSDLVTLNDLFRCTFKEIASVLRLVLRTGCSIMDAALKLKLGTIEVWETIVP